MTLYIDFILSHSKLTPVDNASNRSQMICILSVPSNMNCHDLLTFIAACQENIHHIRIIRDAASLNQYMTLISFRTQVNPSYYLVINNNLNCVVIGSDNGFLPFIQWYAFQFVGTRLLL